MSVEFKNLWIASDHAGFDLKTLLIESNPTLPWKDLGPDTEARVDYPDFAAQLTDHLNPDTDLGVLVCGSGQGMAIKANRVPKIRAALCWTEQVAKLSRAHNNANVLCLGARVMNHDQCLKILRTFLSTPFEGGRHEDRVRKLSQ